MLTTVNELYIPLLQEDPRVRVSGVGVGGWGAFHKFPSSAGGPGASLKSLARPASGEKRQRQQPALHIAEGPQKPTVQIRVPLCSITVTEAGVLPGGLHDSQGEF